MTIRHLSCLYRALALLCATAVPGSFAASIEQSTITQVVKQVNVLEVASKRQKPARTSDVFRMPDVMRTGSDSRAEMIAPDETVTRVGANTVFSFSPESREINLQKGSVLFNSPTGKGGGTIKTAAATASVLGTTIIVVATKNGGFKLLVIEGHAKARLPNGKAQTLGAGQLTFVLPGSTDFGPVITFRLSEQAGNANLIRGFKRPLPSDAKIQDAIAKQEQMFKNGQFVQTNILVQGDQLVSVDFRQVQADVVGDGRLPRALGSDAIINTPKLDRERLFVFTDIPTDIANALGNAAVQGLNFFAARNTTVNSPLVDLSEFNGSSLFAFVSVGDFVVNGTGSLPRPSSSSFSSPSSSGSSNSNSNSTQFIGLNGTPLYFVVGGAFTVNASNVIADTSGGVNFLTGLLKDAPFTITSGGLENPSGNLTVSAPSFDATTVTTRTPSGNTEITARTGSLTVNQAVLPAGSRSGSQAVNVFVAGGVDPFVATGRQSISMSAATDLNLTNTLLSARDISLSARTVNLDDVNFARGSRVTLASANGRLSARPNTNQPSVPGNVNFLRNVTYDFSPAQNFVPLQISIQKH